MKLPEAGTLDFFNKILISVAQLSAEENSCTIDSLVTHCKSIATGGQLPDYYELLEYCRSCGLVQIKKHIVSISALGQKFLDANKENFFEIREAQKELIIERIVFKGPWNNYAREILSFFSLNQNKSIYELSLSDASLTKEQNVALHFFKFLGILKGDSFLIYVDKRYSELVYQLTADGKAVTEQQLEKILMENRKIGAQAENAIVHFEKERLRKMGRLAQAELVKRISTINVSAGYDIESFDGDSDDIFPNRLIEVKATQGDQVRFYWSQNEIDVARKKKNLYWIYLLKEFREDNTDIQPMMIHNPASNIHKSTYLSMEAHTFLIREISDITVSMHSLENLTWYKLI